MDEKEDLIDHILMFMGHMPANARSLLTVLVDPDLIEYTKRYVRSMDKASLCQKFQPPWDCAKEAEARYENVKYGWLGAGPGNEFDWWCENCRKRVQGE